MPNLERLINGGTIGNLAALSPMLSPILWTSIATGKRAYLHGVRGFAEPLPDRSGIQPVGTRSRKCKALWNILSQSGRPSVVCGWQAEPSGGANRRRDVFESLCGPHARFHAGELAGSGGQHSASEIGEVFSGVTRPPK